MKTKEVKALLKQEASQVTLPDQSRTILEKYQASPLKATPITTTKTQVQFRKKLLLWPSLAVTFVVVILLIIFLRPTKPTNPVGSLNMTASKEVIGKEIILAGAILGDNQGNKARQYSESDYIQDVNLIHEYFLTGDMLLNQTNIEMQVSYNDNTDYADYKYVMELVYNTYTYKFYYNESNPSYDGDDLDEVSVDFRGVLVFNSTFYEVRGHRENEENEEFSTETTIYLAGSPYLQIEQETEVNEYEYTYTYYANGKKQRVITQEIEYEGGVKEIAISVEENNSEREFKYTYYKDYVLVEYEASYGQVETELEDLRIYEYEDYYKYSLSNSSFADIIKYK